MKKLFLAISITALPQLSYPDSPERMQTIFTETFEQNGWRGSESKSGTGSDMKQTEAIRINLPSLLKLLNIQTMLDAACGDFNWMKKVDLSSLDLYIGVDIVPSLIKKNQQAYKFDNCIFQHMNIAYNTIPQVDLILCRDCLVHLELDDCIKVIQNFKQSGAKYLLVTTFTRNKSNTSLPEWRWRTLNMQLPPFNFPQPFMIFNEDCSEGNGTFHDKSLGLWLLDDICI